MTASLHICSLLPLVLWGADPASIELTLPPAWHLTAGVETHAWFDNLVLTQHAERLQFKVECPLGTTTERSWRLLPTDADVGRLRLKISVWDGSVELASGSTELVISPASPPPGARVRLLIVGDSLTHASRYPNEVARLLAAADNGGLSWTLLGTHRPAGAAERVAHEGYGGWTWQRFATRYEPQEAASKKLGSSPFVFPVDGEKGPAALDVQRYIREHCDGEPPTAVTFLLGINDCFSADPDDLSAIDARVDQMLGFADQLVAAFRRAAPEADLGVCLTPPPNARESGFEANYRGRYHRWGWKRIQHRLVQRELKHFGGRESERVFVVATQMNVDPRDGYPENNGVHPNEIGYRQIGGAIYSWLNWRLQERRR